MAGFRGRVLIAAVLAVAVSCSSGGDQAPTEATGVETGASGAGGAPVMAAPGAHGIPPSEIDAAIEARLSAVRATLPPHEAGELTAFYAATGHMPVWLDGTARPSRGARTALTLLNDAASEGLDAGDYGGASLEAAASTLAGGDTAAAGRMAAFDVDLSRAMLRYLRHVHVGRIDPREIGYRVVVPPDDHAFPALLASALVDGRLTETVAELRPAVPLYEPLRAQLHEYRVRAQRAAPGALPSMPAAVRPGDAYEGLAALVEHLVALGDLPDDAGLPGAGGRYEGWIVDAVTRFQVRHGLDADGVVGDDTREALSVPLSWRVRQIEMSLERLRWLPHVAQGRVVLVNIPMFHLWSWDRLSTTVPPAFETGIIVGRAVGAETPVFMEDMRYLVFRPYWNVPPSILRGELLPMIVRDPGYLGRERMEIVRGQGDNAQRVEMASDTPALLRGGTLRLRQRPGPQNALGLVKFMFPNDHNVYLHGTPSQGLFSRARRDFSHGCVRVENPAGLAAWVLAGQPEWTEARIRAAMEHGTDARVVNLAEPVQVVLTYMTAMVWPGDGSMRFSPDIYEHDTRLDQLLREPR